MGTKESKSVPKVLFKVRKDPEKNQEGVRTPPEICKLGTWIEQSTDDFFSQLIHIIINWKTFNQSFKIISC